VLAVSGTGFVVNSPLAQCAFVDVGGGGGATVTTAATVVSPTAVVCGTPLVVGGGVYQVRVATNAVDFSSDDVRVQLVAPVTGVLSATPSTVTFAGYSPVVIPSGGGGFHNSPLLQCRFGASVYAAATWVSGTQVECDAPAYPAEGLFAGAVGEVWAAAAAFTRTLSVSNNGRQWRTVTAAFEFVPPPRIVSVQPAGGFGASTLVTVTGDGFVAGLGLKCRFDGGSSGVPAVAAATTVVSASVVTCVAPATSAVVFPSVQRLVLTNAGGSHVWTTPGE
jgi:hypothetical protein